MLFSHLLIAMPDFTSPEIWGSLVTLLFLEIVLGVDNILFISIISNKLPEKHRNKAAQIGLAFAMLMRIALLFGINLLIAMQEPWVILQVPGTHGEFSGQSIILILGGLFLLYKSVTEIHGKVEGDPHGGMDRKKKGLNFTKAIVQITLINVVFSFDSILTAVGMTSGLQGALMIMIIAVVASVLIMMAFAMPIGRFVNKHPTIQILGLSFLLLIGFTLLAEGAHLADLTIAGQHVGAIPKGYLYFAITFSLLVEALNMRLGAFPVDAGRGAGRSWPCRAAGDADRSDAGR